MQSMLTFDLYDLSRLFMRAMCSLTQLSILFLSPSLSRIRMCFLDEPLVVICILGLLGVLLSWILFISMIFPVGRARKALWSLRSLTASFLMA